jgi:uncharacterized repeat protein (TIGR01451 family)
MRIRILHVARVATALALCGGMFPASAAENGGLPRGLIWLGQQVGASDAASGDEFGRGIALDGGTAAIGSPYAVIDGHEEQGAAYVFTESGGVWSQATRLLASDGSANSVYGYSFGLDGTTLLVSAVYTTIAGHEGQGAVYVYDGSGSSWTETQKLVASDGDAGDEFGGAIALDGDTALVGAHFASVGASNAQGKVYVFTRSGGVWSQSQVLTADDGATFDFFGYSVAMQGDVALIGAPAVDLGGEDRGAAYVFKRSGGVWTQAQELVADDGGDGDSFGFSVTLDGSRALVGANYARVNGQPQAGAAYLFDADGGGSYAQIQKLLPDDSGGYGTFGASVALHGDTAFIGSDGAGAVYVFNDDGSGFAQGQRLSSGGEFDGLGSTAAFDGATALAGAAFASVGGVSGSGAAYFYALSDADLPPLVSLAFSPASVGTGDTSTATIAITNAAPVPATLDADFVNTLPAGLVATAASTTCAGGVSFTPGAVTLDAGTVLAAGASCAVTAGVHADAPGLYTDQVAAGDLVTDVGSNVDAAMATLEVTGPAPLAAIAPAALGFGLGAGGSGTLVFDIANLGDADLDYSLTEGAPAAGPYLDYRSTSASLRHAHALATFFAAPDAHVRADALPARPSVPADVVISQMQDNTPGGTGVSCSAGGSNTEDTSWWRRFYFNEYPAIGAGATITAVTIASDGNGPPDALPFTINLYTIDHATPPDTIPTDALTPIGSANGTIVGDQPVSVTVPASGVVGDTAARDLVVEWHTDGYGAGQFYPGANATPETHPTFMSSITCGLPQPTPAALVGPGFPDFHLVMTVSVGGQVPVDCENPADVPWLAESPLAGSIAAGEVAGVAVSADAGGLVAGDYQADVCVATSDPLHAVVPVPVHLVVSEDAPDPVFCGGFENADTGTCNLADP